MAMQYNPYHIDTRRNPAEHSETPKAHASFALSGVLRALVWLLVIAGAVVWLAAGTRPQALVAVLDLVLLFAAGSMVVCLAGLVLLNISDRLWEVREYFGLASSRQRLPRRVTRLA